MLGVNCQELPNNSSQNAALTVYLWIIWMKKTPLFGYISLQILGHNFLDYKIQRRENNSKA